jgi:flagellar hook-associated protein FlgK
MEIAEETNLKKNILSKTKAISESMTQTEKQLQKAREELKLIS